MGYIADGFIADGFVAAMGAPDEALLGIVSRDEMNGTAGTLLTAHAADYGGPWLAHSTSGAGTFVLSGTGTCYSTGTVFRYLDDLVPTADCDVEVEFVVKTLTGGANLGITARMDAAVATMYHARYAEGSGAWQLLRFVAGAATVLGSFAQVLVAGQTYRLRLHITDTNKKVYIDDVLRISNSDNNITGAGYVGLREGGGAAFTATTGIHIGRVLTRRSEQMLGVVDDLRILPTAPAEAQALSAARRELDADEASDAAVYLKFSEGTGTTAFDSSGNGINGTLTGQWVGLEGTPDLRGTRKHRVWGIKRQRRGVRVDPQREVWQVNAGQTQSIVPTENGLASLVYDGDFANIYDWTTVAGHYATQLSQGMIRFHEMLPGTLGFDVEGDVDPTHGYTAVTAYIMRNIALRQAGFSSVTGIDTAAVVRVANARPDAVGIATGSESVSILDVQNRLAGGIDGWWTVTRTGLFTPGVRAEAVDPEIEIGEDDILENGVERVATVPPVRQWTLSYRDYEVVVPTLEEVAGAIPEDERGQFTVAERYAQSPDLGTVFALRHKDARFATGETLYDDADACRRECERRLALDQYKRDVYTVKLARGLFQYRLGQSVRLVYPRFFLGAGRDYVIGSNDEATETGQTTLALWGRSV